MIAGASGREVVEQIHHLSADQPPLSSRRRN